MLITILPVIFIGVLSVTLIMEYFIGCIESLAEISELFENLGGQFGSLHK